jgi:hypothetical protein
MEEMAAKLGGVPVWVGEFGGPIATPGFTDYLTELLGRFARSGWGWSHYSDDTSAASSFAIRNPDGTFHPEVTRLLGHPYARRVPGPVVRTRLDLPGGEFSATFRWEVDAPLELWVGERDRQAWFLLSEAANSAGSQAISQGGRRGLEHARRTQ